MAGTLTISTLSDGTNSTSSTNCIQGSAKAWCRVDGSNNIAASYNVSSVTQPAGQVYQFNFTNALPNANYTAVGTCYGTGVQYACVLQSPLTTSLRMNTNSTTGVGMAVFSS